MTISFSSRLRVEILGGVMAASHLLGKQHWKLLKLAGAAVDLELLGS